MDSPGFCRTGYESATQFSRDYTRVFGLPPARDTARILAANKGGQ